MLHFHDFIHILHSSLMLSHLPHLIVGEIKTIPPDENDVSMENKEGGHFSLELNTRIYTLRAKSDAEAEAWVKVLRKLQEEGKPTETNKLSANAMKGKASLLRAEAGTMGMERSDWSKSSKLKLFFLPCC